MSHRFCLWLVLFHIGFFALQFAWPISGVMPLLWLMASSGIALVIPFSRSFIEQRSNELSVLNLLLVVLHILWLLTGINPAQLSIVGFGLLGGLVWLWHYLSKKGIELKQLDLAFVSVVVSIAFVVITQTITIFCVNQLATDFDSQNFLTWAYTAHHNYLPYKDIVYWYGLFSYFAASHPGLKVLVVVWTVLIFTALTVAAARLIKDKFLLSGFLLLCLTIIQSNTGYGAFFRYGSSFGLSIASSYVLSRKVISKLGILLLGLIAATLVFLISDQGIYFSLIVAAQIFLRSVFVERLALKKTLLTLVQRYFWFGLGYAAALLVAFTILQYFGMLPGYIENVQAMSMMGVFAKVELGRLLFSKENILTTVALFVGSQLFIYQSFFAKTKPNSFNYLLNAAWLLVLWLCQNKFLIRPWFETQFILVTFAFYAFQIVQLVNQVNVRALSQTAKTLLSLALITGLFSILAPDKAVFNLFVTIRNQYAGHYAELIKAPGFTTEIAVCLSNYFGDFTEHVPQKYTKVFDWIAAQPTTEKPLLFSFPGEPIFYVRNQQKPPAYFNAYDASSITAQQRNIDYMVENNVRYIIWDTDSSAIQDNVPDILRNNLVVQHIFRHYTVRHRIGNFLIFERTSTPDNFLTNKLITTDDKFYESLTYFNLKFYPVLLQKKMQLKPRQIIHDFNQTTQVVLPARKDSELLYLWLSTKQNTPVEIEITNAAGLKTMLAVTSCFEKKSCLIPLNQLPLFFTQPESLTIAVKTAGSWEGQVVLSSP